MKQKQTYTILRTLLMVLLLSPIMAIQSLAHSFEVDGIYYNITSSTDKTVSVTYYGSSSSAYPNRYTESVTIPSTVVYNESTYSITNIGNNALGSCKGLISVTIPNSVTNIGNNAFQDCM